MISSIGLAPNPSVANVIPTDAMGHRERIKINGGNEKYGFNVLSNIFLNPCPDTVQQLVLHNH